MASGIPLSCRHTHLAGAAAQVPERQVRKTTKSHHRERSRTHWARRIDKRTRRQSERTDMMSWGVCMSAWAKADTFWRQEGQGPSRSNWAELSMIKWHSSAAWERRSRHSHIDCSESKPCCTSGCSMRMAIMKQLRACNKMRSAQVKPGLAGTLQRLACTLSCFFDEFIMTNAPAP